jgi:hypothetical protein
LILVVPPEIELADPKDIHRDFLDDHDDENGNGKRNRTDFTGTPININLSEQRRTIPGRAEFIQWYSRPANRLLRLSFHRCI